MKFINFFKTFLFALGLTGSIAMNAVQFHKKEPYFRSNSPEVPDYLYDVVPATIRVFFPAISSDGQRMSIDYRESAVYQGNKKMIKTDITWPTPPQTSQSTSSVSSTPASSSSSTPSRNPDVAKTSQMPDLSKALAALTPNKQDTPSIRPAAHMISPSTAQTQANTPIVASSQVATVAVQGSQTSNSTAATTPASNSSPTQSRKLDANTMAQIQKLSRALAALDQNKQDTPSIRPATHTTSPINKTYDFYSQEFIDSFSSKQAEYLNSWKGRLSNHNNTITSKTKEYQDLKQTYEAICNLLIKNYQKALKLLTEASEKYDDAIITLAYCYLYGIGTNQNKELAQKTLNSSSHYQEDSEAVNCHIEYLYNTIKLGL